MRITEDLLTGVKRFKKPVYQASFEKSLRTVLGTEDFLGVAKALIQFPGVDSYPWCIDERADKMVITNFTPIKHRIFNTDELDFLIAYDELGELNLNILMCLANDHDRCTFEVHADQFVSLFRQLPNLVKKYKYNSNVYNIEGNYMNLCGNYTFGISFYKMRTFLYDIYGNSPEGVGVTFEFFNKRESRYSPSIPVGYYLLLTDVYEGVFYMDGRERYNLIPTDFKYKTGYIQSMVDLCTTVPNNIIAVPVPKAQDRTLFSSIDKAIKQQKEAAEYNKQQKETNKYKKTVHKVLKGLAPLKDPEKQSWGDVHSDQVVHVSAPTKKKFGHYSTKFAEQKFRLKAKDIALQFNPKNNIEEYRAKFDLEKAEEVVQKFKTTEVRLRQSKKKKSSRTKIDFDDYPYQNNHFSDDSVKEKNIVVPEVYSNDTFYEGTTSATSTTSDNSFFNSNFDTYYIKTD